jgi:hypothetical protein
VTFTNPETGVVFDPATVILKVQDPAAVVTTLTYGTDAALTKVSTGIYSTNVNLPTAGEWNWTYTGFTGTDKTVVAGELLCEDPGF